jgi:hypothetical protein
MKAIIVHAVFKIARFTDAKAADGTSETKAQPVPQYRALHLHSYQRFISRLFSRAGVANATETCAGKIAIQMTTARRYNLQGLIMLRAVIKHHCTQ